MISHYNLVFNLHHILSLLFSTSRGGSLSLRHGVLFILWAARSCIRHQKQDKRLVLVVRPHIMRSSSTWASTSAFWLTTDSRNKSKILLRCKERYRARRYDQCTVDCSEVSVHIGCVLHCLHCLLFCLTTYSAVPADASPAEIDITEIQKILAQLETFLWPGGVTAYVAALAEDIHHDDSLNASDRLLDEMETLRDLRDRSRDICVRIWERDGATKIWEQSRQYLRPFQEALDLVDNLYDQTLSNT